MLPTKTVYYLYDPSNRRQSIEKTPLLSVALPSLLDTTNENDNIEYLLLVAYNHDDVVFEDAMGRKIVEEIVTSTIGIRTNVHMLIRPVYMTSGTTVIWNTLASWGYDIGCDYFVPSNDDLLWRSMDWALFAIDELRSRTYPCPNFGIVGFSDEEQPNSPTFHVISRLHVHIHSRAYYPVKLLGYGVDPWIFESYKRINTAIMSRDIVVANRVSLKTFKIYLNFALCLSLHYSHNHIFYRFSHIIVPQS